MELPLAVAGLAFRCRIVKIAWGREVPGVPGAARDYAPCPVEIGYVRMSTEDQSLLCGENAAYLQLLYDQYRREPGRLAEPWQALFKAAEHSKPAATAAPSPAAAGTAAVPVDGTMPTGALGAV